MQLQPNQPNVWSKLTCICCTNTRGAVLNVELHGAHCNQNLLFSFKTTVNVELAPQITSCWIIRRLCARLSTQYVHNVPDRLWLFVRYLWFYSLWMNLVLSVASQKGSVTFKKCWCFVSGTNSSLVSLAWTCLSLNGALFSTYFKGDFCWK